MAVMSDRTGMLWAADQFAAIADGLLDEHIAAVRIDMATTTPDPAAMMVATKTTISGYTESALTTILAAALVRLARMQDVTS